MACCPNGFRANYSTPFSIFQCNINVLRRVSREIFSNFDLGSRSSRPDVFWCPCNRFNRASRLPLKRNSAPRPTMKAMKKGRVAGISTRSPIRSIKPDEGVKPSSRSDPPRQSGKSPATIPTTDLLSGTPFAPWCTESTNGTPGATSLSTDSRETRRITVKPACMSSRRSGKVHHR